MKNKQILKFCALGENSDANENVLRQRRQLQKPFRRWNVSRLQQRGEVTSYKKCSPFNDTSSIALHGLFTQHVSQNS